MVTLDSLYAKYGPPDVIKIDVEGEEYSVLQGAKDFLSCHPVVFLATHSGELANGCCRILLSAGYELTQFSSDEFVFSSTGFRRTAAKF